VVNQLRGLLLERGITLPKGRCHLESALRTILKDSDAKMSGVGRLLLEQLQLELEQFITCVGEADALIQQITQESANSVSASMRSPVLDHLQQLR
jgi:transposase